MAAAAPRETRATSLRDEHTRKKYHSERCGPHCQCSGLPRGYSFGTGSRAQRQSLYAGPGSLTACASGAGDSPGPASYDLTLGSLGQPCKHAIHTKIGKLWTIGSKDTSVRDETDLKIYYGRTYAAKDEFVRDERRPPPRPASRDSAVPDKRPATVPNFPRGGGPAKPTSFRDELKVLRKSVEQRASRFEASERAWRRDRRLRERYVQACRECCDCNECCDCSS